MSSMMMNTTVRYHVVDNDDGDGDDDVISKLMMDRKANRNTSLIGRIEKTAGNILLDPIRVKKQKNTDEMGVPATMMATVIQTCLCVREIAIQNRMLLSKVICIDDDKGTSKLNAVPRRLYTLPVSITIHTNRRLDYDGNGKENDIVGSMTAGHVCVIKQLPPLIHICIIILLLLLLLPTNVNIKS